MKLSVSAYRAHASAHKKILDTSYSQYYGSTSASHLHPSSSGSSAGTSGFQQHLGTIDPPPTGPSQLAAHSAGLSGAAHGGHGSHLMVGGAGVEDGSSDDANTPLHSPRSHNTSREEDESSNANESDCKSPNHSSIDSEDKRTITSEKSTKPATQSWRNLRAVMAYYHTLRKIKRTKSNQRWMKLRTTVQISSAISAKKPQLKREDSFLKRFSTRQIPEVQETVEDTGSEGCAGDNRPPRRRRKRLRQPRSVVNPDSNFYFYWLFVLTICVLYNMWTLIVRQSFPELQEMLSTFWLTCDSLSDLVFLFDLAVQFRTGYLEQGLMVYDSKKLACHYLRSRAFLLDLTALCPVDLLQLRFGPNPLLRCPRFLKVYRAVNYYYMVESRTVWPNLWRVVNLIHILLILAHWFGCFYFLLSEAEGFQGDWVYPYRPGDYATLTRKYLGSLYWSTLTLTTIGDLPTPETNAEKTTSVDGPRSLPRRGVKSRLLQFNTSNGYIFTIVSYLIGVFIFATIVGQVGNVITNRNANRLEFERLLDGAKTYMRHHKVPGGMKRRVLRWYDYSWSRGRIQGGGDINTALGLLPDKLKTELALHVNLSVLKKVTIFQECQPEFLRDLVLKMKAYIFTPGDSICRKGEVAREMFIIADGILEVISEAGKVLTTMKAGDFFGEIGILNLDGLNKRTADVRSVGYSELFSLSREDVLAAMKDYPEAQEILQALGRKRLMEVKASAKHPPHHKSDHHHHHGQDTKGLVDKIKNEAKGLKNALRKSRTHYRRSDESLELQPLQPHSGPQGPNNNAASKGTLKRMSRVKSHDLSQDHPSEIDKSDRKESIVPEQEKTHSVSPLGAGLPLLQRLRLLKEKQEKEEKGGGLTQTSPLLSPQSTAIRSPPIVEETSLTEEPVGAGLPLLQRILMLKAKEEKSTKAAKTGVGGHKPFLSSIINFHATGSTPSIPPTTAPVGTQTTAVPRGSISGPANNALAPVPAKLLNNKVSFRDRIKMHTTSKEKDSTIKDSLLKDSEPPAITEISPTPKVVETNVPNPLPSSVISEQTPSDSFSEKTSDKNTEVVVSEPTPGQEDSSRELLTRRLTTLTSTESTDKNGAHWSKLKRAAISKDLEGTSDLENAKSKKRDDKGAKLLKKPGLVLSRKTKHYRFVQSQQREYYSVPSEPFNYRYRSIDDLSPEYGPLPFVKKLKILNERQKLEELETAMKTRSFSLDIPESQSETSDTLTRSHSEGSSVHQQDQHPDKRFLTAPLAPSPLNSSNESNETPERRNLKSILKKLSEDTKEKVKDIIKEKEIDSKEKEKESEQQDAPPPEKKPKKMDSTEFKRLMRAPTIEGYAARHSKLSKSVTFNRDTLQSPPNSANTVLGTPQSLFPFVHSPTDNGLDAKQGVKINELERCNAQIVPNNKTNNQVKIIKSSLDEQQYFADILLAIKQVMSAHLQEMQLKFQERFDRLEEELRNKNDVIQQLRAHICELENTATDNSFSDSIDTIISRDKQSWEDPTHEEEEELQELPQPINAWQQSRSNSVVLNIDTTTDTDSDNADGEMSENDPDFESGDNDQYENSSSNWEIELLAAQMRERRAGSLDHTIGRPLLRNRFLRGSSMDGND